MSQSKRITLGSFYAPVTIEVPEVKQKDIVITTDMSSKERLSLLGQKVDLQNTYSKLGIRI